jgi:glycerate kinase
VTGSVEHVVVAPDKFKGSLTAAAAAARIACGISAAAPGTTVSVIPVADGGEGTVLAAAAAGFDLVPVLARGPSGEPVTGWLAVRDTVAVVEAAQVSGLQLVPTGQFRPLTASSYGTGQLIAAAADLGCREVILGLGGVAGTDGGAGLAQGLGALLLDERRQLLPPGGGSLAQLSHLDLDPLRARVAGVTFTAALDVDNPLLGPRGAAAVYGPQKGASPGDVALLDGALTHWADIVSATTGSDLRDMPGAGAAGGLGFGVLSLLNATGRPGISLLLDLLGFATALSHATLVVTGEGCLDQQTLHGKAPVGVLAAATAAGIPVAAVAGRLDLTSRQWREAGFAAAYALVDLAGDGVDPIAAAGDLAEQAGRLIAADFLSADRASVPRQPQARLARQYRLTPQQSALWVRRN